MTPELTRACAAAMLDAMCGDYCADQACMDCEDARVDAMVTKVVALLDEHIRKVTQLTKEGVCHKDAMTYLQGFRRQLTAS